MSLYSYLGKTEEQQKTELRQLIEKKLLTEPRSGLISIANEVRK